MAPLASHSRVRVMQIRPIQSRATSEKNDEGGKERKSSRCWNETGMWATERERDEDRGWKGKERREYRTIVYQRLKQTHRRRWLWSAGLIYRVRRPRPRVPTASYYPFPLRASRGASSSARIDTREKPCTVGEEEALQPFYDRDFASRAKHVPPRCR